MKCILTAVLVVLLLPCRVAFGISGKDIIGGCNAFLRPESMQHDDRKTLNQAYLCAGIIDGVSLMMDVYSSFCPPQDAILAESQRVVTKFLNENPSRLSEDFRMLVFEALAKAWPCDENGWRYKCNAAYRQCWVTWSRPPP